MPLGLTYIFTIYEERSRQAINYDKSNLFLSKGAPDASRQENCAFLQILEGQGNNKVVGPPFHDCKLEIVDFVASCEKGLWTCGGILTLALFIRRQSAKGKVVLNLSSEGVEPTRAPRQSSDSGQFNLNVDAARNMDSFH
ncbi:hypothetical protein M9H77_02849 [Catharanthus roseus]|uniref:Uncharacterized protein n=1 Tax=Catharanthus roseus TaxID=4058 RepID=A0ACC0C9L6_CATRO|nr:hypothetical protein M9H77_02849 [Catharanthus roseus]